jgi:hypothetical protein
MQNRDDKPEGKGSSPVPCSAGSEFAEGHRIGYEAGLRAGSLPDGEVARVLLPLGVTALSKVVDGLGKHFGDDLRMMQRGDWLIFIKPNSIISPICYHPGSSAAGSGLSQENRIFPVRSRFSGGRACWIAPPVPAFPARCSIGPDIPIGFLTLSGLQFYRIIGKSEAPIFELDFFCFS